jgi:hypothetical protein
MYVSYDMREKFFIVVSLLIVFLAFTSVTSQVFAQSDCTSGNGNYNFQNSAEQCPATLSQIESVAIAVIEAFLVFAVIIFFFRLILNGFSFITAGGNPDNISTARKGILFSTIGFGAVFSAFIILNIISHVTGVNSGFTVSPSGGLQFNIMSPFNANGQ